MNTTQATYAFRKECVTVGVEEDELRRRLTGDASLTVASMNHVVQLVWTWAEMQPELQPTVSMDESINGHAAFFPSKAGYKPNTITVRPSTLPVRALQHEACHAILYHKELEWGHTAQFRTLELLTYEDCLPEVDVRWKRARAVAERLGLAYTPRPAVREAIL